MGVQNRKEWSGKQEITVIIKKDGKRVIKKNNKKIIIKKKVERERGTDEK